jgi:acyl carrier protein
MTVQLTTIPKRMQPDVISSFWSMLGELRTQANNDDDRVLKVQVEGWYRQWNAMTGDNREPNWSPVERPTFGGAPQFLVDHTPDRYAGSTKPDDVAATIRTLVCEHMGLSLGDLDGKTSLSQLGADSLDEIELVMALEDEFIIEISDEEAESMDSLDRAVEIVLKLIPKGQ